MSRLEKIISRLVDAYHIDIEVFLELYKHKASKESICEHMGLSYYTVRQIGDKLGLPWNKSARAAAYVALMLELDVDKKVKSDGVEATAKENDYLHKKLSTTQAALERTRHEVNHLRRSTRTNTRSISLEQAVQDVVAKALPIKHTGDVTIHMNTGYKHYENHVVALVLSDLHVEEAVNKQDVGLLNEYNWNVVERRLGALFAAWFNAYRGESKAIVVCAGDFFTGFIHNALENTTKHPAEAIQLLSDLISRYLISAAHVFDSVHVPVINGNHSRFDSTIKSASKGLDLEYLFGHLLKAKVASCPAITVDVSTTGYVTFDVGDKVVGVHHGDFFRTPTYSEARTFKVEESFKKVTGKVVNHVIQGHTHAFSYTNITNGSLIVNGSLIGSNTYGHTNGFSPLRPSQTIIQFLPDGEIDNVKQVFLD
jgi:predicted phosphodiesterase